MFVHKDTKNALYVIYVGILYYNFIVSTRTYAFI